MKSILNVFKKPFYVDDDLRMTLIENKQKIKYIKETYIYIYIYIYICMSVCTGELRACVYNLDGRVLNTLTSSPAEG